MDQTKNKIEKILEKVRPFIQMHGGDAKLIRVKNGEVILKISGACVNCSLTDLTYNKMIGGLIKEETPQIKKVIVIN
ncbi:MAG: NifU family protein [Patescibacteria group bacterium]|nr:NifU family protein [Patescibacteria group bacterium]